MARIDWHGVFPAVTTQFKADMSVDIPATQRVIEALLKDGVSGLIICGTVGENTSLSAEEKRAVLSAACDVASGKVPVLAGVAEYTTELARTYARDAKKIGVDGLMVL